MKPAKAAPDLCVRVSKVQASRVSPKAFRSLRRERHVGLWILELECSLMCRQHDSGLTIFQGLGFTQAGHDSGQDSSIVALSFVILERDE